MRATDGPTDSQTIQLTHGWRLSSRTHLKLMEVMGCNGTGWFTRLGYQYWKTQKFKITPHCKKVIQNYCYWSVFVGRAGWSKTGCNHLKNVLFQTKSDRKVDIWAVRRNLLQNSKIQSK